MKLFEKTALILVLIISFSCGNTYNSSKIKSYKIKGLNSNFSLPERFETISGTELISKTKVVFGLPNDLAKDKIIKRHIHFIDYENNDLIIIEPILERLHIEEFFLNSFVDMIEEGTVKKTGVSYELISKKFITTKNNNNAFKAKFKYKTEIEDKYFTTYFLTTKNESLSVSVYSSYGNYDLQDMITRYLNKN
jgi:hypothetical protein